MNSLFRNLTRLPVRQTSRSVVLPSLARPFSIRSIAFNQQQTSTKPTQKPEDPQKKFKIPDLTPLKLAHELYATVRVHNNPFLVTVGDVMTLPYHLKTANVGDVLNFTDVTTIGSRNFTYHHEPINPNVVSVKAVVIEKTKLPMRIREVTKRRQRKIRHAISKPHKTLLRVTDIKINV